MENERVKFAPSNVVDTASENESKTKDDSLKSGVKSGRSTNDILEKRLKHFRDKTESVKPEARQIGMKSLPSLRNNQQNKQSMQEKPEGSLSNQVSASRQVGDSPKIISNVPCTSISLINDGQDKKNKKRKADNVLTNESNVLKEITENSLLNEEGRTGNEGNEEHSSPANSSRVEFFMSKTKYNKVLLGATSPPLFFKLLSINFFGQETLMESSVTGKPSNRTRKNTKKPVGRPALPARVLLSFQEIFKVWAKYCSPPLNEIQIQYHMPQGPRYIGHYITELRRRHRKRDIDSTVDSPDEFNDNNDNRIDKPNEALPKDKSDGNSSVINEEVETTVRLIII